MRETYCIYSDGYIDQFGEPKDKEFKIKNFRNLLFKNWNKPLARQNQAICDNLNKWISYIDNGLNYSQIYNVCIMEFKF